MKKIVALVLMLAVGLAATAVADDAELKKEIKELKKRLMKIERKAAVDRVEFTGDFRFEAHNINGEVDAYVDGMALQNVMAQTLFYFGHTGGMLPMNDMADPMAGMNFGALGDYIQGNAGDYMAYANSLDFAGLQTQMGGMMSAMAGWLQSLGYPPMDQATLMEMAMGMMVVAPGVMQDGYDYKNDIMYTNRLRLNMKARVGKNVSFSGRLGMYKPWGDSSGLQVFNGQSNSLNIDGNTTRVPNSDILRVERAYFNWNNLFDSSLYLSIGRRPSTGGPPMHLRDDEMRAGTPLGTIIDFQFDGITAGFDLHENSKLRLCYGMGYESGFGSAENLKRPADRLKDCHFFGVNWDVWAEGDNFVQATVARAFDVTDGFNGLVVLPDNPVSGDPIGAPMAMRFTPSANLGDIDLASLLVMRKWKGFDFFASYSVMKSHPEAVTTPFGGLFCDPFETPEEQTGKMAYAGARYSFADEKTKMGLEYNKGNQYWFNFAHGSDDLVAPKTGTRGEVWEAYVTHRIDKRFVLKLDYMHYSYDYSGSGWHLGAPKDLGETPILGYQTFSKVDQVTLSTSVRF